MKLWSAFYPDLVPELPGAAFPIIDHWLRNTAIDFFDRSKAYVVDLAAVDAVASQMGYTLTLPANTDLVEIKSIFFSGKPLDPKARQFLESRFPDWRSEVGTPDYYTQQDLDKVLLVASECNRCNQDTGGDQAVTCSDRGRGLAVCQVAASALLGHKGKNDGNA